MFRDAGLFAGSARCAWVGIVACVVVACAGGSPQRSTPAEAATAQPGCTRCFADGEQAQAQGDAARAVSLFERGCQRNEAAACDAAARMHARGEGVPENDPRAISLYVRGCELGHGPACADIGRTLAASQTRAGEGRALLVRGCEGGDARACVFLADAYQRGLGGPVDPPASTRTFERACKLGSGPGCTQTGIAFHSGRGVASDLARARALYEQGCERGDLQGCGNFGVALRDGLGGPVDTKRSVPLFERACAGGQTNACVSLGAALFRGDGGLEPDRTRALALFETACRDGDSTACDNLDAIARAGDAKPADRPEPRWTTSIGTLTIGSGDRTATFEDVRSTCNPIPLAVTFGAAAGEIRECLDAGATRRVSLATEAGRLVSSRVEPDDAAGRCVVGALGRAPLGDLTCAFEASVSR